MITYHYNVIIIIDANACSYIILAIATPDKDKCTHMVYLGMQLGRLKSNLVSSHLYSLG